MLDKDTTFDLIYRAKQGESFAKEVLITENSPLIKSVIKKYINKETNEVSKIKMSNTNFIIMILGTLLGTFILGYISKMFGGNLPFVDALSTTVSIVAMIVSINRYTEQWILWLIVNTVSIGLWSYNFFITGGEDIATLVMWIIYWLNALISYIKWRKESNTKEVLVCTM